jgi:hypothetical protein
MGEEPRNDLVPIHLTLGVDDLRACRHPNPHRRGRHARRSQGRRMLPQLPRRAAKAFARRGHVFPRSQDGSISSRAEIGTCWSACRASCRGRVEPYPSWCIHDETLYKVRHPPSFFSPARLYRFLPVLPLSPLLLRVPGLKSTAWSSIVLTIIPNAVVLSKHLRMFARACSAIEAMLFEWTTFLVLVIAASTTLNNGPGEAANERTGELNKALKLHSCARRFHAPEMGLLEFMAVLGVMTPNMCIVSCMIALSVHFASRTLPRITVDGACFQRLKKKKDERQISVLSGLSTRTVLA